MFFLLHTVYFNCLIAVLIAIKLFVLFDPVFLVSSSLMSSDFEKKKSRFYYCCDGWTNT